MAGVGGVEQDPRHIDDGADGADDEHYLEVEAAEELLQLRERVEQAAPAHVLPGDEVDHADGLAGQLQLHGADNIALLDGGADIVGQMEVFLSHGAVARRGQQGHHAVVRVELEGVGVGGILHGDLCQSKVGVQRRLDGKALEHPVDEAGRLIEGRAAVGVAVSVAGVGALHDAEDIGGAVLIGPRNIALVAVVVFVGHHIAHTTLHRLAVEAAAAGLVEGDVLVQQHETLGVLFLGGHGEGGGRRDVHEGVEAHQIPQDEVHIHGGGHVAAVEAAGVRPGASGGADALGKGVHLAHPACKVAARKTIGEAHRGLVGVAQKHGVDGFPVGEGLIGAHIGIVTVVDIIRDGKGHLEGVVELVGVIRQQQRDGHIFGQAPGRHLTGAVLVVDDDVGVGVDDVGALGLHLVEEAGVEHGRSRRAQAAQQQDKAQK